MSATDIPALLRFLTKDAKVDLATAMSKVKALQDAQLDNVEAISKVKVDQVTAIFPDEKAAKAIHNAAKRINKKRAAGHDSVATPSKRLKKDPFEVAGSRPASEVERELELTVSNLSAENLEDMAFMTNRAPLVLAFAATVVKFTMPEQPPSSQLSLAQAVVSLGSQSKAKAIGLKNTPTAEDEGWNQGQPTVTVMNREISVLKRWGYNWQSDPDKDGNTSAVSSNDNKEGLENYQDAEMPALWAIDLEQLKRLNGPLTFPPSSTTETTGLPVYPARAAKGYLLRSFDSALTPREHADEKPANKKKPAGLAAAEREANVACLLRALDLLFESWTGSLSTEELDKRSWSWYVHVRPNVEQGVPGWGQKGLVKLKDILDLRRKG